MIRLTPSIVDLETVSPDFSWTLHQDVTSDPDPDLIESIERFGLLRPIVLRKNQHRHELICGTRRLIALRRLGKVTDIPCFYVDRLAADRDLLMLVAEDQKQTAPLSPVQTARLIKFIDRVEPQPGTAFLQALTATGSDTERKQLLKLLVLEKPIRLAIHQQLIPMKTALTLIDLTSCERLFYFELFTRLSLNANKQRRLLELARIISVAEQCSMIEVFTRNYPELCSGLIENIPQASSKLMKNLFERSHPGLTGAQKQFKEQVNRLNLPGNCRLEPSPAFERETLTLSVEFKDFKAFEYAWQNLQEYI